jgi:hypothetical protein
MDTREAAQRWADVDLAGVSLLRFRADGLVIEHRDFWSLG